MNKDRVLRTHFIAHLTDSFQKRETLDIPDRTSDFHYDHIHVFTQPLDRGLDFIGDVGNDLHRVFPDSLPVAPSQ